MDKATLAMQYNPNVCQASAVRLLNKWIERNKILNTKLKKCGYRSRDKTFTPAQVKLIKDYLGDP